MRGWVIEELQVLGLGELVPAEEVWIELTGVLSEKGEKT
jgi:hypothetical protein